MSKANIFRKSVQKDIKRQSAMSIEKPQKKEQKEDEGFDSKNLGIIVHNGETKRFHFLAQQPQRGPTDPLTDNTILWFQPIPLSPQVRKRVIVFRQLQYIISNWTGDQFPSVIYIAIDGMSGFNDIQGLPTTRMAALQLDQVTPVLDDSSLRTHDLKYVAKQTQAWNAPSSLLEMRLRVFIDNETTAVNLPLPNPISVSFQLRAQF